MILKLISSGPDATEVTVANEGTATGFDLLAGYRFGDVVWQHQFSGQRGTQGARAAHGIPQNRPVVLPIRVTGATKDAFATNLSTLSSVVEELRRYGGDIVWRSASQSYRQRLRVLTGSAALDSWGNRAEVINRATFIAELICAPLAEGEPMRHLEEWAVDNVNAGWGDYTADAGALTDVSVAGGRLTSAANHGTSKSLIHTGHGYTYGDVQARLDHTPGSTVSGYVAGVVLKRIDASNYIEVYVDDDGANTSLVIDKVVGGSRTQLQSTTLGTRLTTGTTACVVGRIEGGRIEADAFDSNRSYGLAGISSVTGDRGSDDALDHDMSAAELTTFGPSIEGSVGLKWEPISANATIETFEIHPWVYRGKSEGDTTNYVWPMSSYLAPSGAIPGDAPALGRFTTAMFKDNANSQGAPEFAMFAWARKPAVHNMIPDGDVDDTDGPYRDTAVSGVIGAATSIVSAGSGYLGTPEGTVTTPATANTGAHIEVHREFRQGVTYTLSVWVRHDSNTTNLRIGLGVSGDIAQSTPAAISSTFTQRTVEWTPDDDYRLAYAVIAEGTAADATVVDVSGIQLYEGTTAPTGKQELGEPNGYPPFGVIPAAGFCDRDQFTDGAGARWSRQLTADVASATSPATAGFYLDATLLGADDYSDGEAAIEVWAKIRADSNVTAPKILAWVNPGRRISTSPQSGGFRYSAEFGSTYQDVINTGSNFGTQRLGTFMLDAQQIGQGSTLVVSMSWTGGTNDVWLEHVILTPARSRCLSPTGKDSSEVDYPAWIYANDSQTEKRVESDLSASVGSGDGRLARDHGLGGSLIEIPPGEFVVCPILEEGDPDDDEGHTSALHGWTYTFAADVTPRWHYLRT